MQTLTKTERPSVERLRQSVTSLSRLLNQTISDVQLIESEFEEAEEKTRARVTEHLEARAGAQKDAAVKALRSELIAERALLGQEIEELRHAREGWETERAELVAEVRRLNLALDEVKEEYERSLAEIEEAAAFALDRQIATAVDRARANAGVDTDALRSEVIRVENLIQMTAKAIENPQTELSEVIRKNGERAALESYLRGVRFALPPE